MKTKIFFTVIVLFLIISAFGQKPTLELTFTAIDNAAYVQLDSIKVMNRTQEGDTVLYWPDTVLLLDYQTRIPSTNIDVECFKVFQNYPNPAAGQTTISLFVPDKDNVSMIVTDMLGRVILKSDRVLDIGTHSFRFVTSGENHYFFTAQWRHKSSSIKILQTVFNSTGRISLEYTGSEALTKQLKATEDIQSFNFSIGDELLYIGYTNGIESGMLDTLEESQTYTFQFASNIPCPDSPTVEYEGQVYNTIQIFSQCWLKENLNIGVMIQGSQNMTDNGIMEKYCYNNEPDSCTKYGGLYQWDEMMQYTTQQGVQGICPPDWHIPTDEEWKVLEGATDDQYGIGDIEWEYDGGRGYNAGLNLKTTDGWYYNGNGSDLFGFSGIPGGNHWSNGSFHVVFFFGYWWTTTESEVYNDQAYFRQLSYGSSNIVRFHSGGKDGGFSVRCIKNE